LQLGSQYDVWVASNYCNSKYFYNVNAIAWIAQIALDTTHHIWNYIFIENMFDFVQLSPIMLQLGCPYKFLMQNTMNKQSYYVTFHSSIEKLLMFIAINLQLMHYQIIVLQLMNFDNGSIFYLELINLIINCNLSIYWWNHFVTNVHLWMVLFCTYWNRQW
jgi:hypothetical protein